MIFLCHDAVDAEDPVSWRSVNLGLPFLTGENENDENPPPNKRSKKSPSKEPSTDLVLPLRTPPKNAKNAPRMSQLPAEQEIPSDDEEGEDFCKRAMLRLLDVKTPDGIGNHVAVVMNDGSSVPGLREALKSNFSFSLRIPDNEKRKSMAKNHLPSKYLNMYLVSGCRYFIYKLSDQESLEDWKKRLIVYMRTSDELKKYASDVSGPMESATLSPHV